MISICIAPRDEVACLGDLVIHVNHIGAGRPQPESVTRAASDEPISTKPISCSDRRNKASLERFADERFGSPQRLPPAAEAFAAGIRGHMLSPHLGLEQI